MLTIRDILTTRRRVAVVGCSAKPIRTSHQIAAYLQRAGYSVTPVNPGHKQILGEQCYPSLAAIPDEAAIDLVLVFRRSERTLGVVEEVVARFGGATQEERPVIWTQLGVASPEAKALADESGFPYVVDRCIMVDHSAMT